MNIPEISVIVPVYNAERFLKKCIESILYQDFTNFELLLVNDGSKDSSGKICDEYASKDSRIKVFHKLNEGVSIARNTGIEYAKANWICFIDSDDWVEKDYLSKFIADNINKETIIFQGILFDYAYASNKNKPFFQYDDIIVHTYDSNNIVKYNLLENGCPVAKLYNKSILNENNIRFNTSISTHEDHLFVWSYLQHVKSIRLSSCIAYHYMKHNTLSLSSKFHPSEEYLLVSNLLLNEFEKLNYIYKIRDIKYINYIRTKYGISQLVMAARNSSGQNFKRVWRDIKKQRDLIIHTYTESGVLVKLIQIFLKFRINPFFLYLCIAIKRNFK